MHKGDLTLARQTGTSSDSFPLTRQWPEVSDFVARFCTLRESENTRTCENCTRFACKVCFLTRATCKKV